VRLLDAGDFARSNLGQAARLDEAINLQRQVRLEPLALGVRKAEVGENIAAALADAQLRLLRHG